MPSNLLDKATEAMLNKAVHSELYASHLYKHVSNQMQRLGFFGTQKFFAGESADELTHYQRIADYMKGPQGRDRTKQQWEAGGFHKPGSNKK